MRSETKARLLTNKMKSYGAAARFQRAWRNYAQYIYFPCVYAMQKFFRACGCVEIKFTAPDTLVDFHAGVLDA